jgi:SAM-dependent methyltransferase
MKIENPERFEQLVSEALAQDFSGWDWTYTRDRFIETPLPWDYRTVVLQRMQGVRSMLDIGTGGGEALSSLAPLPPDTLATESYSPNIAVARQRLEPLGIPVVAVVEEEARTPLEDGRFDLVINRHASVWEEDTFRLLKPGGRFITQQVGGRNMIDLNELLQEQPFFIYEDWTLKAAVSRAEAVGFRVLYAREAFPPATFTDIGAVVFYLKIISWQVDDFSVEKYYDRLVEIHNRIERSGPLVVHEHRFFFEAERPLGR